jgi:DNA-binding transcriptional ArsR family regulator
MNLNMNPKKARQHTKKIANLFRALGQASRLRILLAIGEGEACVCHLEANLGYRQAYISQQLMELRKARVVDARRDGRFIYYRLRDPSLLQLIKETGKIAGIADIEIDSLADMGTLSQCCCPNCAVELSNSVIAEKQIS